jgi:hypothetical protein
LIWTVRQPDGSAPDPGQVSAVRVRILRPDETEEVLSPSFTAPQTYTILVGFPTHGDHSVRFETDGLETAWEKIYRVNRSSHEDPD